MPPDRDLLPDRVRSLLDRPAHAVRCRRAPYQNWCDVHVEQLAERQRCIDQNLHRRHDRGIDYGIGL